MVASGVAASALAPRRNALVAAPELNAHIPTAFGIWKEVASPFVQVSVAERGEDNSISQPYDQVVMRRYASPGGQSVLLALAWGGNQRQEIKVHRPEVCYLAQGFEVQSLLPARFVGIMAGSGAVTGKRMLAYRGAYGEAVSYWIRIGRLYSEGAVQTRLHILREGLSGRTTDGILVRASVPLRAGAQPNAAFELAERFLGELVAATPQVVRALLVR
jgi:EpsI family protein